MAEHLSIERLCMGIASTSVGRAAYAPSDRAGLLRSEEIASLVWARQLTPVRLQLSSADSWSAPTFADNASPAAATCLHGHQ